MPASDFSLLHLKLDRILEGQDRIVSRLADTDETIRMLIVGLEELSGLMAVHREWLEKLSEALSHEEPALEMHDLIASIAKSLHKIETDGGRMIKMLGQMPTVVSKAAQEGARFAMGHAIDVP